MVSVKEFLAVTSNFSKDAVKSYFSPMTSLSKKKVPLHHDALPVSHKLTDIKNSLRVIHSGICFNQGSYIQYSYLAAERHKKLKNAFLKNQADPAEVSLLVEDLMNFLNTNLLNVSMRNFELLKNHFSDRSSSNVRVCMKGNFKTHQHDTVISVFRDSQTSYYSDCEIEKNTGFHSVFKTGKYYINNNLITSAREGLYKNPRLDQSRIEDLSTSKKLTWEECWTDYGQGNNDMSSFYKSTLIIPITLWNNDLSKDFIDSINLSNVDRVIFGFLCFDNVDTDFFNEDIDVSIGYIFADMLSLYLVSRLVYTELSETYRDIQKFIKNYHIEERLEKLESVLTKIHSVDIACNIPYDILETSKNQLFAVDSILKDYVAKASKAE